MFLYYQNHKGVQTRTTQTHISKLSNVLITYHYPLINQYSSILIFIINYFQSIHSFTRIFYNLSIESSYSDLWFTLDLYFLNPLMIVDMIHDSIQIIRNTCSDEEGWK